MKKFASEEILFQHFVLTYKIDLYFSEHRLAIEIDEKDHNDRNIGYETERQKTIEKKFDCEVIRINPDGKYFVIYIEIGKIYNHIKESNEKSLTDKILKRLSELQLSRIIK